ncbi:hypothetical protein ATI61_110386 [Archangium gephyra]|uniref:Uncharacterized protein n=1 Tax=Archangium gephyra TaxID=48 RepID=A0AAC8THH3_9BACT|nr:hypothetical protein [Archangium gephyra]AKJ05865.1 Hypothetical protein AA314_07491 [Archangium gephyra]REG27379.1 hypothetical protein ATI61_110386 [Archangium gephyra]
MAQPAGFDRDIGYLMPFLDRVTAAAETLPDATAREELKRLMADEKARWARIQQLLGGAAGKGTGTPSNAPQLARARADEINREQPRQAGLTVGSLKRQS